MSTPSAYSDLLDAERFSPFGPDLLQIHEAPVARHTLVPGAIHLLVDRAGDLPAVDPGDYDICVTTDRNAPAPWVSIDPRRYNAQLAQFRAQVARNPIASATLAQVLRVGEGLPFDAALTLESYAYSTLLGGSEFARWAAGRQVSELVPNTSDNAPVLYARDGDAVTLTLSTPHNRNAMTAAMRDALYEALANVVDDPSQPTCVLRGEGRCFSTGGDIPEFGSAKDLAVAHFIRTVRSNARLLHALGGRAQVVLHGACVGSGIEVAAAAARRSATRTMFAQLPETTMGLIPGAGGTVTIPRAIGRHRTAWMALGNFRVPVQTAYDWGLVHEIVDV